MIKYVVQTCDWCGVEGKSVTLGVPEGWFVFDLRGGKEPGIVGFGWNVCSRDCMEECIDEWMKGTNPRPYGVPEPGQSHDHMPPSIVKPEPESEPKRKRPCGCGDHGHEGNGRGNGSIADIARASADLAPRTRRYAQVDGQMVEVHPPRSRYSEVPLEQQGHGGH